MDQTRAPGGGYFTKSTAQAWLDETLASARRGDLAGAIRTGATLSEPAAERACKPTTLTDYGNMVCVLNRRFGDTPVESVTADSIEHWKTAFMAERKRSNRTLQKYLVVLHGDLQAGHEGLRAAAQPDRDG